MKRIITALALLLFASGLAHGQAGYIDKTFGDGGVMITTTPENGYGYKCILLPDEKILQTVTLIGGTSGAMIYRYEHNGKIDSSFGDNGRAFFPCPHYTIDLQLAAYQDGRILFYAVEYNGDHYSYKKTFIYRMLPSGTIDSTFGTNGKHYISDYTLSQIWDITITSDEKIFAVGEEGDYPESKRKPVFWRLTPNGEPDSTFGTNGKIVIPPGRDSIIFFTFCKDSNGRFVFFYKQVFQGNNEIHMLRVHENGSIDTTFGSGGLVDLVLTDSHYEIPMAMTLPDGSIVFAMNFGTNSNWRTALVKLTKNGELDPTFGSGGAIEVVTGLNVTYTTSIALDSSGRIIASGLISPIPSSTVSSSIFRILQNGVLDSTFGLSGVLALIQGVYYGALYMPYIVIQPDGKYLISGNIHPSQSGPQIMLVRLNPDPKMFVKSKLSLSTDITVFPTPSTDNCTVTYTLPTSGECTMTLRDESGREVRTFVANEYRIAGEHEEELDLRGLASGVYFLQIESAGTSQTVKLIKH